MSLLWTPLPPLPSPPATPKQGSPHPLPPPKQRSHLSMMLAAQPMLAGQLMRAGSPAHIIAIGGDGGRFNLTST